MTSGFDLSHSALFLIIASCFQGVVWFSCCELSQLLHHFIIISLMLWPYLLLCVYLNSSLSFQVLPDLYLGNFKGVYSSEVCCKSSFLIWSLHGCSSPLTLFACGVICLCQMQETGSSWPGTTSHTSCPSTTVRLLSSRWESPRLLCRHTSVHILSFSWKFKRSHRAKWGRIRLIGWDAFASWSSGTSLWTSPSGCSGRGVLTNWASPWANTRCQSSEGTRAGGSFLPRVILGVSWKMPVNSSWFEQCAECCACVGLRVGGCSCFSRCGHAASLHHPHHHHHHYYCCDFD